MSRTVAGHEACREAPAVNHPRAVQRPKRERIIAAAVEPFYRRGFGRTRLDTDK